MYVPKALVVYLLTFRSFRRSSSDVLSVKTAVFLSKVIHFPGKFIKSGRAQTRIRKHWTFNVRELQRSVSTKIAAWRPGNPGTFMKLYLGPGAYLGVHFYIFELYTKFRVAWYQKREFCKFIEIKWSVFSLRVTYVDYITKCHVIIACTTF